MTKREPQGTGEVGALSPGGADSLECPEEADGAEVPDEPGSSLLDRWQAHHQQGMASRGPARPPGQPHADEDVVEAPEPVIEPEMVEPEVDEPVPPVAPLIAARATVSRLEEARARREGPVEPEPPLVDPIPLRRPPEPDPDPAASEAEVPEAEEPVPPARPPADAVRRPRHAAPPRRPVAPTDRATDLVAAGRDIRDALGPELTDPLDGGAVADRPTPKHAAAVDPSAASMAQSSPSTSPGQRAAPVTGASLHVEFPPKMGVRRVIGFLLLVSLVATCGAAYFAYDDPRPLTLGSAGTLLAVTLVLYAVRAGSSPTHIAIRSGQLEVVRGKVHETFDLTSRFTRIEIVGKPGRHGWKVLLGRFGKDPLVIDSSLVDPKRFTAELQRYRPRS
ncbi:hypothetical protein BH09ACT12_BH09ACT12_01670 [soil metagenome]